VRILKVSDVYFPRVNGVSTSIQTFRRSLRQLGHETVLVAPAYPGQPADDEPGIVRVPSRGVPRDPEDRMMRYRDLVASVRALVAGGGFDAVHVHTPFLAHYAALDARRRFGLPVVETYHTYFEEYLYHYVPLVPGALLRFLARRLTVSQCNAVDLLVVPSEAMLGVLRRYGVRARTVVIPTGIELERFRRGDGERFRRLHGIDAGRPVLAHISRVAFEKNIDFIVRSFARVHAARPDALLLIAGEGPAETRLRSLAVRLGLADAIRFLGYLDRAAALRDCYSAADIFVFASRTETQGLVLLEAMALGVPVVSTAVLGTADVLRGAEGAIVVEEDEAGFAAAVLDLIRDPGARARLASGGPVAASRWSATAQAQRLAQLYPAV
jgi:glycosyltransferase involved in cell wall biosynthesis